MKVDITDIGNTKIKGVRVFLPENETAGPEKYFEWRESALTAKFESSEVSGGVLNAWHHALEYEEAEYHRDEEMFYFVTGTAIMMFVDLCNNEADLSTVQVVRIQKGTQLIIEKGKGHFVAIAEGDEPVKMIVVAPKMPAPRIKLKEKIQAVRRE